jgi:hypothetical protein
MGSFYGDAEDLKTQSRLIFIGKKIETVHALEKRHTQHHFVSLRIHGVLHLPRGRRSATPSEGLRLQRKRRRPPTVPPRMAENSR